MKKLLYSLFFIVGLSTAFNGQATFRINDLLGVSRVSDPQLSPDGRVVAYTVGVVDKAANRVINQIYTVNIDGSNPRQKFAPKFELQLKTVLKSTADVAEQWIRWMAGS